MLIVNLSNLCWKTGQQRRNQAIFSHLLLDTDGYEEGIFLQPPTLKAARMFQLSRSPELQVAMRPQGVGRPVTVLQPSLILPSGYPPAATKRAIAELGQKLVKEVIQNRPYLLWINSITHFQAQLAEYLLPGAAFRVFDASDLLMMYERNGGEQFKQMTAILNGCEVALSTNESALPHIQHPVKCVLSHYTEFSAFQHPDPRFAMAPLFPKPAGAVYIGFTGMLTSERVDFDLLHAIMTRFPKYQFLFVGSTNRPNLLARLKSYPNFHYIPEVHEQVLSSIIHQLDVAIVPELDNEYTRGSDGKKILDYLACGVPVLSSMAPNGERFGDSIHVARSIWEFSHSLERLVLEVKPHEPKFGKMIAQQNSWCGKVPQFVDWLADMRRQEERQAEKAGSRLITTVKAYL